DYGELMLFLVVAITYVNTMQERRVFDALRTRLVNMGLSYRQLFWLVGGLAFVFGPIIDNLTTALVMGAVVIAVGVGNYRFIVMGCIIIVIAANAGGVFSPFGDITSLMVWQKGKDRKSTRLNSSHVKISYAVFCLKKKKKKQR